MTKIWGYILVAVSIVAIACSSDINEAHDAPSPIGTIEIIEIIESNSSNKSSSSFNYRSTKTDIFFSNHIEIKVSSSSKTPSSSSKPKEQSSSSKPDPKSSSSSAKSSSSVPQSSSSSPKSSASLRFFDCTQYDCVTMDYLNPDVSYGEMLDKRDNQVYRTLVISNHVWTAQNMNYNIGSNVGSQDSSWCYDNSPEYCQKFGRLYNWEAAQKACPEGWHLPAADEWLELLGEHSCSIELYQDTIYVFNCAGDALKAGKTWDNVNENPSGFSVVAAGIHYIDGFHSIKSFALFWTATEFEDPSIHAISFNESSDAAYWPHNKNEYGLSVRCVKGDAE